VPSALTSVKPFYNFYRRNSFQVPNLITESSGCIFAIDNVEGFFLVMELRKHPLMSYRGRPNWPPRWVWLGGKKNERPTGEVGVLKEVSRYSLLSSDGLTLVIEYNESAYMGLLLFDDFGVCRKIHDLLKTLRDRPIAEIGSLDI
jgi:hypothetical protein